ncbi:MAG: PDZ domain-containing protein [Anaerolineae bacterium]
MIVRTVAFLGLEWHATPDESSSQPNNYATVVRRVVPNSPAHHAGVQVGDIIHGVDGAALTSQSTLTDRISQKKPGVAIVLNVTRNQKRINMKVVLGERQVPVHLYTPTPQITSSNRD